LTNRLPIEKVEIWMVVPPVVGVMAETRFHSRRILGYCAPQLPLGNRIQLLRI
jgi:hypothetical protein